MSSRLALHPDTYRVPVDNGVYLLGPRGPMLLNGASIAAWLERLAPVLDGTHSLEDLTKELSPERREMVESIVASLLSRGVVQERDDDEYEWSRDADVSQYAPEVGFIADHRGSALAVFSHYRDSAVLVVGSGQLLPAVVRATLRSGLRTVHAATAAHDLTDQLAAVEDEARRRDPEHRVHEHRLGSDVEAPTDLIHGVDLVLQVGEGSTEDTRTVERHCEQVNIPLAQAIVHEGAVWLVPPAVGGAPRWSTVEPRLRPGPTPSDHDGIHETACTAVASQFVQSAFRFTTGVDPTPDQALASVDLSILHSTRRRFLPHPLRLPARAPSKEEVRARWTKLAGGADLTEQELSQRAAACVDDQLGIVTLREHDWAQSPLHVTEATAHPTGPSDDHRALRTVHAGLTYQAARVAATMRAMAVYGASTVDPRRLVDTTGHPLVDPDDEPYAALAALRTGSLAAATWGYELTNPGRVRLMPAAAAFPGLRREPTMASATVGLGAGLGWDAAVVAGLLSYCHRHTLAEIAQAASPFPEVDATTVELDATGARCRGLLTAVGQPPAVYDVTGSLGVPSYAFCAGPETVTYATAESAPAALARGFTDVLRAAQARAHGQAAVAPPAVPNLPAELRGQLTGPVSLGDQLWDVPTLAGRLHDVAGWVAVAVALDHDPALAAIMPYLVQVVACDD